MAHPGVASAVAGGAGEDGEEKCGDKQEDRGAAGGG